MERIVILSRGEYADISDEHVASLILRRTEHPEIYEVRKDRYGHFNTELATVSQIRNIILNLSNP